MICGALARLKYCNEIRVLHSDGIVPLRPCTPVMGSRSLVRRVVSIDHSTGMVPDATCSG